MTINTATLEARKTAALADNNCYLGARWIHTHTTPCLPAYSHCLQTNSHLHPIGEGDRASSWWVHDPYQPTKYEGVYRLPARNSHHPGRSSQAKRTNIDRSGRSFRQTRNARHSRTAVQKRPGLCKTPLNIGDASIKSDLQKVKLSPRALRHVLLVSWVVPVTDATETCRSQAPWRRDEAR